MTEIVYRADALGHWHASIGTGGARIVSLVPSITELLCDLGLAPLIVGRTGFCIHPQQLVAPIAKVGGTKDVNVEKIRRLAPTHLIVNVDENEKPCVDQLATFVPHVIVTHPQTVDDNLALFDLLGGIFNAAPAAARLSAQLSTQLRAVRLALLNPPTVAQRVLYCIWQDPWMTVSASTYIADMLRQIGWQVVEVGTARYPVFTWSAALIEQVDLILLSTEPYRFTPDHVDALERQSGKPVILVDGELLSWYGGRSIAGLHYLKQLKNASR